jgi:basic amino acid/polyamine antiporter, APA family
VESKNARPFGFWTATALVVGGMIGSGIFMMPVSLAPFGWTSVVAWIVSIAGAVSIAFALARLAQTMPDASGAIAVTGAVLGEFPGLLIGWSYWVSVWAANAAIAIAATSYLAVFVPALNATPLTGALVAVALIWLLTLLNLAGAKRVGEFQVLTTLLKLAPLIAVILIATQVAANGGASPPPLPPAGTLFTGLGAAVALTLFPLVGFEAAGIAAERVRDPARNVMRATMAGTVVTGLLYILVCSAILLILSPAKVAASGAPFQLFVETFWGQGPALAVALFAAIAAIGALNCWVLIQGEVPLGMARAGLLPGWFAKVTDRDVPARVLVVSSALASLLVLFNASKSLAGVFAFAALLTTCATLWLYVAICISALMRRVAVGAASIGLPFALFAFWGAGYEASGLSLLLMLTGIPVYLLRSRGALAEQPA